MSDEKPPLISEEQKALVDKLLRRIGASRLHYILDGKTPKLETDYLAWAKWFEAANRVVLRTTLQRGEPLQEYAIVSTIFLGLNHNWSRTGPPVLFETMAFLDGTDLSIQRRYTTWDEAERGHREVCREVEEGVGRAPQARSWRDPK